MAVFSIVAGPTRRNKSGSGRLGVRKNSKKRLSRQIATLEAAAVVVVVDPTHPQSKPSLQTSFVPQGGE